MSRLVGIDLGTTNSCVAVLDGQTPRVLVNREGHRTTPSVVAYDESGERLVGEVAKRQAVTNPRKTIHAAKRLIGRKIADEAVAAIRSNLAYTLTEATNGDVRIKVADQEVSPQEVSAAILAEIKASAEAALGEEVTEAVVTVPAHFDDAQRQATKDAGRIAGLNVARIINEPTAAALAYGINKKEGSHTVAVYDLGGGTFDISILQLVDGVFEVRSTSGDTQLGGEDFDQKIMRWMRGRFEDENGVSLADDRMALQRLREAAEAAKCELSTQQEAVIGLPFLATGPDGPLHLNLKLTRPELEEMVGDLVGRTEQPCRDALEQAGLRVDEVDEILLVGGQTRMPLVSRRVEEIFGKPPSAELNPDEVVAMGAAIQGGILTGDVEDVLLLDVTPLSLSVETKGGLCARLIERNSTIPTKNTQLFTTVMDDQEIVEIHVVQGEREIADDNRSLGRFELVGIAPAPRGAPQIDVTFSIDSNGIVNVSARDLTSQVSQSIEINPTSGLSEQEIERLVEEAEEHRRTDLEAKEVGSLKNRLEGLIYNNERVFQQFESMLSEEDRKRVNESLLRARMAIMENKRTDIESSLAEIKDISDLLSDAMLSEPRDSA